MVVALEDRQRIARLTPLDDVLLRISARVQPVAVCEMTAASALGRTLVRDAVVVAPHPAAPLVLIDGWAVYAETTADASTYAPAIVSGVREVAVGEALGPDADAVVPLEAMTWRSGKGEVQAPAIPGDGVLMPGGDAGTGEVLRQPGHRLRAIDVAVFQALGVADVRTRKPRIRIASVGAARNVLADAIVGWIASAVMVDGGEPVVAAPSTDVQALLMAPGVDAVVLAGGTGRGARDHTVRALAQTGTVEVHGIAMSPGESAAFGFADSKPVLLVPGRLDSALAVWLLIGRPLLTKLRGGDAADASQEYPLTAKVVSTVGFTEWVPVRRVPGGVAPLASRYLPLAALAQADSWIIVPAASEGLAVGTPVTTRPLP
jgi:molybdopterin molybdotransferase